MREKGETAVERIIERRIEWSFDPIKLGAVVPQDLALVFSGNIKRQKALHGIWKFGITMRVIGREH